MEISDVHKNTKLIIDGSLYVVEDAEFMKPGKGRSVYRLKMRNLKDGKVIERTYRSGDSVEAATMSSQDKQYLYCDGDHYVFMDGKTFEQVLVPEDLVGDRKNFLLEGMTVTMQMRDEEVIDMSLPNTVELRVVEAEVSSKGATISPQSKASVLETGYTIETPQFIKEGDVIRVDTRTGTYVERVTGKK